MSKAKQSRRVAKAWAETLGSASGIDDVEDKASGPGALSADELRGLTRPGSWDGGAINAGSAAFDGCPKGYESVYYAAYDRAACKRSAERADELDQEAA